MTSNMFGLLEVLVSSSPQAAWNKRYGATVAWSQGTRCMVWHRAGCEQNVGHSGCSQVGQVGPWVRVDAVR